MKLKPLTGIPIYNLPIEVDHLQSLLGKLGKLAGCDLCDKKILIDLLPPTHNRLSLPKGKMAVYIFYHKGQTLKVGKAGPNSNARFQSHHYNPNRAKSTLAAQLTADRKPPAGFDINNPGKWICENTGRINILMDKSLGDNALFMVEGFLQALLRPTYEGRPRT